MKASIVAALTLALLVLLLGEVGATTITLSNLGQVSPNTSGALISGSNVALGASFDAPISIGANPSDPLGWDPWGANDKNSQWLSVGGCCGSGGSGTHPFATFNFTAPETTFTLLWGSPNSNNTVTLYSGANGTGSVIGTVSFQDGQGYFVNGLQNSVAYGPNTTGPGDIIAISSTVAFQSAILANAIGGFEVADLSARAARGGDPTPLPAALPLLATGLGALGLLGWRRKRKARVTNLSAD